MKFLCDNCKAKYQIADEKVGGRTVRMKCRKCGHLIEARPTPFHVPSTGPSIGPPAADVQASDVEWKSLRPPRPAPAPRASTPPPPAASTTSSAPASIPPSEAAPVEPPTEVLPAVSDAAPSLDALTDAFQRAAAPAPRAVEALSAPPVSPEVEWFAGIGGAAVGPMTPAQLRERIERGDVGDETLIWRDGMGEWSPMRTVTEVAGIAIEIAAAREAAAAATRTAQTTATGLSASSAPGAAAASLFAPPAATAGDPAHAGLDEHAGARAAIAQRYHQHPVIWIVVMLAGVLVGVSLMAVVLLRQKPAVAVAYPSPGTTTIGTASAAAPGEEGAGSGELTIGAVDVEANSAAAKNAGAGAKAGDPKADPKAAGSALAANPNLTSLTNLTGGPTAGPATGGPAAGGGGALSATDVERVVSSHRALVKRQCWDPALSGAKGGSAPKSTRVTASVTVGTNGKVQSASVSGGDGYPGLASCVQGQVRNWTFPPSDGATLNVPFVFAAQ